MVTVLIYLSEVEEVGRESSRTWQCHFFQYGLEGRRLDFKSVAAEWARACVPHHRVWAIVALSHGANGSVGRRHLVPKRQEGGGATAW